MLIDTLLRPGGLRAVFQPIVHVDDSGARLYGLEALVRGAAPTHFESAEVMFEYVRWKRAEARMDVMCIATSLEAAMRLPASMRLSLNVHAATLVRAPDFPSVLRRLLLDAEVDPTRVTLELTEHTVPWLGPSFHQALAEVRRLGIAVALDDVGMGQSNFKMIVDVRPDVLKVDRYFVHGVAEDPCRQAIVDAVVRVGARIGAKVIAEGVSEERDLIAVRKLGIELVQGFFISRPKVVEELLTHPLLLAS